MDPHHRPADAARRLERLALELVSTMIRLLRALLVILTRRQPGHCRHCGAPALAEFKPGHLLCAACAISAEQARNV